MKHALIAAATLTCLGTSAFAQDRLTTAMVDFQTYCLGPGGDLDRSISKLSTSGTFRDGRRQETGGLTYASFTGPDGVNASVMIGGAMSDDRCTIIVNGVDDPQGQSASLATALAEATNSPFMEWDPFGDYGNGGFGYQIDAGDIVIAPLTTGISDDILHLVFFPT